MCAAAGCSAMPHHRTAQRVHRMRRGSHTHTHTSLYKNPYPVCKNPPNHPSSYRITAYARAHACASRKPPSYARRERDGNCECVHKLHTVYIYTYKKTLVVGWETFASHILIFMYIFCAAVRRLRRWWYGGVARCLDRNYSRTYTRMNMQQQPPHTHIYICTV